jgi:hypothetical protein
VNEYVTVVPLCLQLTAVHPGAVWLANAHPDVSKVAPLGSVKVTVGFVSADEPAFL